MRAEARIRELGYNLPLPAKPAAAYIPWRRTGNLLFISGQDCRIQGVLQYAGKVGQDVTLEQAYEASRTTILNALAVVKAAVGDLDKVKCIVNLKGYVNSAPGFVEQPYVINGASEFLQDVFGEQGRHSRCALGANELPFNTCVEIEMVVEVEE